MLVPASVKEITTVQECACTCARISVCECAYIWGKHNYVSELVSLRDYACIRVEFCKNMFVSVHECVFVQGMCLYLHMNVYLFMSVSFLKYREKSARMCLYVYMNVFVFREKSVQECAYICS